MARLLALTSVMLLLLVNSRLSNSARSALARVGSRVTAVDRPPASRLYRR